MYAAVRRYKMKAGSAEEVARRAQEFVPLIRGLPGFVAYYGVAGENDTVVTMSVFEDRAGEEESTRRAADWVKKNLAEFVEGPPEVVSGQVAWHG